MSRPLQRFCAIWLVTLLVFSTLSSGAVATETGAGTSALATAANDGSTTTFAVTQDGSCTDVTPLGDGTTTVESFYDYERSPSFSSLGTQGLQDNQVSNLFVYHGSEGYSLVFVHDKYGSAPYGGTMTATVSGLPSDGEWAVEDDDYQGQDDRYTHKGSVSAIDWMWTNDRTDGGAFRGLTRGEDPEITVDPAFNEEADAWNTWRNSGTENDKIDTWRVYTDQGSTSALNMNQNVTVSKGGCGSGSPTAAISASSTSLGIGESVTFDASGSSDDDAITEYAWDVDGDNSAETTTAEPSLSYSYSDEGTYDVTVTVTDSNGNTDSASTSVSVEETNEAPTASLTAPAETSVGSETRLDASGSSDDGSIKNYRWDLDGDDRIDQTTTASTTVTSYDSSGTVTPEVTVVDDDGATASATTSITITSDSAGDTEPPTATLSVPGTVSQGETVTATVEDIQDDSEITHVCWYVDGDPGPEGRELTQTFSEPGTHTVTVEIKDAAGNTANLQEALTVESSDSEDPGDGSDGGDGTDSGDDTEEGAGSDDGESDTDRSVDLSIDDPKTGAGSDDGVETDGDTTTEEPGLPAIDRITMTPTPVTAGDPVTVTVEFAAAAAQNDTVNVTVLALDDESDGTAQDQVMTRTLEVTNGTTQRSLENVTLQSGGPYRIEVADTAVNFTVESASASDGAPTTSIPSSGSDGTTAGPAQDPGDESATGDGASGTEGTTESNGSGAGFGAVTALLAVLATILGVGRYRRRP